MTRKNFFASSDRKGLFALDGVCACDDTIDGEPCISINGIRQGWGCAIYMDRETAKRVANEILEMLGGEDSIHDYRRKLLIELDKLIADHEKVALDYPDDQALKISTEQLKIHREELIESLKEAV